MTKKWYTSKTVWTGVAGLVSGVGIAVGTGDMTGLLIAVQGVLGIVLRIITHQPLE